MNIDEKIKELLEKETGLKKWIRKILYRGTAPLLEAMLSQMEQEKKALEAPIQEHALRVANLEVNIRNNNNLLARLEEQGGQQEQNAHSQEKKINGLFEQVLDLSKDVKALKSGQADQSAAAAKEGGAAKAFPEKQKMEPAAGGLRAAENAYEGIDYFDFENQFRGSDARIRKVQEQYLPYFENCSRVIDIGCGKGEFLELLESRGICAVGIDLYGKAVEYCRIKGLCAQQADAIEYIENLEGEIDGIFAGQIVEHLTIEQIVRLCRVSFEKLKPGSCLVMETPNPTCLAIYTHAFYMDPSHVKPVHPLTLKYCAQKAGFSKVDILYTENSRLPVDIPPLKGGGIENLEAFNQAMTEVSNVLFGSQDYAVIARK